MDTIATLRSAIKALQDEACLKCETGLCIVGLDQLIKKLEGVTQSDAVQHSVTQPKTAKLQRKTAKPTAIKNSQRGSFNGKEDAVLNYVAAHPGSKSKEIAEATAIQPWKVKHILKIARRQEKVLVEGQTSSARWSMAPKVQPSSFGLDDDETLVCKMCNSPASSPERLKRHMQVVHGKV